MKSQYHYYPFSFNLASAPRLINEQNLIISIQSRLFSEVFDAQTMKGVVAQTLLNVVMTFESFFLWNDGRWWFHGDETDLAPRPRSLRPREFQIDPVSKILRKAYILPPNMQGYQLSLYFQGRPIGSLGAKPTCSKERIAT